MKPLLYLQALRVKNGIARSFRTPVRAAMTVFIAGYILFTFLALWNVHPPEFKAPHIAFSPSGVNPVAIFTLLHALLLFLVLAPPKYLFNILSETDIANLFPLPLKRWTVFRFFLFTRSLLIYLLIVCFGALYASMALRTLVRDLIPSNEHAPGELWTLLYVVLMVLVVAGMLFWRLLVDILREFRWIPAYTFRIVTFLISGSIVIVFISRISPGVSSSNTLVQTILGSTEVFPLAVLFAPFHFLAQVFLRQADFSTPFVWFGLLFWTFVALSAYQLLHWLEPTLYDYAARLAASRTELTNRMRSPAALLKHKADQGQHVVRVPWFLRFLRVRRAGAILWRDSIIAWRSYGTVIKSLNVLLFIVVVCGWLGVKHYGASVTAGRFWAAGSLILLLPLVPLTLVSITSLADILRTSDVQKPLPIGNRQTISMHVLQWSATIWSVFFLPYFLGAILFRQYWGEVLFLVGMGCSFSFVFVSAGFLVALFNPDQHDPIQRMYSGLFGFFGTMLSAIPGALTLVVSFLLHFPLALIGVLVIGVNGGVATVFQLVSTRKYATFVFTE
jgi:hypothetical protein